MHAILSDYLWLPSELVLKQHTDAFSYQLIDGFTKRPYWIETFGQDDSYYRFPRGNLPKLRRLFSKFKFIDKRTSAPLQHRLRFTGTLYEEQKRLISEWLHRGYGMIQSPPRSGKTVLGTALMCKLRQRTLMLAHLEDLCHQLEDTIRRYTNVNELEDECGEKLVGVLQEWDDFFPIATLSTYQCFAISKRGREVLRDRRDYFGLVLVDEVHKVGRELFQEVIDTTTAAYRCGLTATPTRKDGRHVVAIDTIGPVVTVGETEQLNVQYTWEWTGVTVGPFNHWGTMWNRLVKRKNRDKQIARKIVDDVRAGHFVLATTERIRHLDDLKLAIQKIDPDITVGLLSGKTKNRESFRTAVKRGEYQVTIAMNKIVELGYNVPRWSCFHNTLPMGNRQNWYQRISRIRTPMEPAFDGDVWIKPQPVARIWVDNHAACHAYRKIVEKENNRLGFECLNPEPKKRNKGRQVGLATFEDIE